jgi:hypothetical protein
MNMLSPRRKERKEEIFPLRAWRLGETNQTKKTTNYETD